MAQDKVSVLTLIACSIMLLASVAINYVTYKQKNTADEPRIYIEYHPSEIQAAKDSLAKYRADTTTVRRVEDAIRIITGRNRTDR